MATLDELITTYADSDSDTTTVGDYFTIDNELRTVSIPSGYSIAGVAHDANVNSIPFKAPRYYDGHDLSTMTIYIHYINASKQPGVALAENVEVKTISGKSYVTFQWLTTRDVFTKSGSVSFSVSMRTYASDNTTITKEFNTRKTEIQVLEGVSNDTALASATTAFSDVFKELKSTWTTQINTLINNSTAQQLSDKCTSLLNKISTLHFMINNQKSLLKRIGCVEEIDSAASFSKTIKSNASDYIELKSLGGYSFVENGVLKHAGISKIVSQPSGTTVWTCEEIVSGLNAYGAAVGNTSNRIYWDDFDLYSESTGVRYEEKIGVFNIARMLTGRWESVNIKHDFRRENLPNVDDQVYYEGIYYKNNGLSGSIKSNSSLIGDTYKFVSYEEFSTFSEYDVITVKDRSILIYPDPSKADWKQGTFCYECSTTYTTEISDSTISQFDKFVPFPSGDTTLEFHNTLGDSYELPVQSTISYMRYPNE